MPTRNRGKPKPKLRDLSRTAPTIEELAALKEQFHGDQPPIVKAIIGQSLLEIELDTHLRHHFYRKDDATWEKLTSGAEGPLSSFNSKIIAAHAFGICNDVIRDGLNTVRQIRNAFAHSKRPLKFSNKLIVHELTTVTLPAGTRTSLYSGLHHVRDLAKISEYGATQAYVMLCLVLDNYLLNRQSKRLKAKERRRSKRSYQSQLAAALAGRPPTGSRGLLSQSLVNQTAGPSSPTPESDLRKHRATAGAAPRKKGK